MIQRAFWVERIEGAWREAPIDWLAGVRRMGKTTLAVSRPTVNGYLRALETTHAVTLLGLFVSGSGRGTVGG